MQWELITNIILIASIITILAFVCLAIYQWIDRKSLKKIDPELFWLPLPFILLAVVYLVFEHFIVLNMRPLCVPDDPTTIEYCESSFPSTHTMIITTIFFVTTMILPRYVKNKTLRIVLEIIMMVLISLNAIGRVQSQMHWPTDVVGGVSFAFIFSEIYYVVYKKNKKKRRQNVKHLHQNN